jgi:lysophospholipid acyltransferase (LPLAT)-like uncharacterized protein
MLRKLKQDLLRTAGTFILPFSMDVLCRSLKKEILNKEIIDKLDAENKNYVFAFWHGTMLLPWYLQKKNESAALISKSRDGDLLVRVLRYWNYEVVRGSSSSGGDVALGILVDLARNRKIIAITPDGPRGPAYKMKAGAVITAKKSGIPIVLAGVAYKKKKVLSNWDKFEVPLPFTRARIVLSNAIYVNRDLSYNETSELIMTCENELNELQRKAGEFNCSD